ncbi:MAG: hypothetical protein RLZZ230_959 [Candidatus Parcubacteria bacterium]|jgi:hypothetical protein
MKSIVKAIRIKFCKGVKPETSNFSEFFRNASSGEKKQVFADVARKASADQKCFMN